MEGNQEVTARHSDKPHWADFGQFAQESNYLQAKDSNPSRTADLSFAAATLAGAALLIATRGKSIEGLAHLGSTAKVHRVTSKTETIAMQVGDDSTKTAAETARTSTQLATKRSAAEQGRYDAAAQAQEKAWKDFNLDKDIRERAEALREQWTREGQVLGNPKTGLPISSRETGHAAYIDSLPRRNRLAYADNGTLLPGMYRMSFADFKSQFGVNAERKRLLEAFEEPLSVLSSAGVKDVHVGGSFVTKKAHPWDIDFAWDRYAKNFDAHKVANYDWGVLMQHNSSWLRGKRLQMLIDPPAEGTYKGILNFLAHQRAEWEIFFRGRWKKTGLDVPKGIVELDLTTMPKK